MLIDQKMGVKEGVWMQVSLLLFSTAATAID
jgi:hypothetical protein